jgi:hypothetical protein
MGDFIVEAAGCLDIASSIEEALCQIRAMVWEEVYVIPGEEFKHASHPWEDEEYIYVYSSGVSLPAPNPDNENGYQAAAARSKGAVVGRISRKKKVT